MNMMRQVRVWGRGHAVAAFETTNLGKSPDGKGVIKAIIHLRTVSSMRVVITIRHRICREELRFSQIDLLGV